MIGVENFFIFFNAIHSIDRNIKKILQLKTVHFDLFSIVNKEF